MVRLNMPRCAALIPSTYTTIKLVNIESQSLACSRLVMQFFIIIYIFVYSLYLKGGSNALYNFVGEVDIKLKGAASWNSSTGEPLVFDSYDLVTPPLETGAAFVATNFWVTPNQSRKVCPGSDFNGGAPADRSEVCSNAGSCPPDVYTLNGITTGGCRKNELLGNKSMCLVHAWCPVETHPSSHLLPRVSLYTFCCCIGETHCIQGAHAGSELRLCCCWNTHNGNTYHGNRQHGNTVPHICVRWATSLPSYAWTAPSRGWAMSMR